MQFELDHLFICTSVGAPVAERLIEFGLSEGAPNRHPGQGTANRRFFFANAFLELFWVDDPAEAQSPSIRRTGLWERWSQRGRGSSPFGICLRPVGQPSDQVPFPAWEYRPPYLPDPLCIQMSTHSEEFAEPLLFYIAFRHRADSDKVIQSTRQPLAHAAGLKAITRLRVGIRSTQTTSAWLGAVERQCPWLTFAPGGEDLMEVGFDDEAAGKSHDFRPSLPLILRW